MLTALTCCALSTHAHADLTRNLAQAYADTKAAMQLGAGSIVCIGDSLTFRQGGFYPNFRPLVQGIYGNGGAGYEGCGPWDGDIVPAGLWTLGAINTDTPPHHALDGLWLRFDTGQLLGSARIFSSDEHVRLFYAAQPSGGSFIVRYPNTNFIRLETNGTNTVRELAYTFGPSETRELRVEPTGNGPVLWLGIESTRQSPGPLVHRVANGGWGVDEFLRRDWTFDATLARLNVSMYIIMLGQNDGVMDRATFGANMNQLVTRVQNASPGAEVVLVSSYDSGAPWSPQHALAMEDVAIARGVGFFNLFHAFGTHQNSVDEGYLDPDGVHFSPQGGAYAAQLVFDALEQATRTGSECDPIDFNHDTLFPDAADLDDFVNVFAGGVCAGQQAGETPCNTDIDFNNDGISPDTADIEALLRAFAGGGCG